MGQGNAVTAVNVLSAGGVLLAVIEDIAHTVILHRISPDEWRLPKGKVRPGESPQQTAQREVYEETGIKATPWGLLGETAYQYQEPTTGRLIRKRVLFYLMPVPNADPITVESPTFAQGLWVPALETRRRLTFATEREIVAKAVACGSAGLLTPQPDNEVELQ